MLTKNDRIYLIGWTFIATLIDLFRNFPRDPNIIIIIEAIILGAMIYFLIGLVILIVINTVTKFLIK